MDGTENTRIIMSEEQLDELEEVLQVYRDGEQSYIAPKRKGHERVGRHLLAQLPELITLAREGLRLREPPIDGDYLRQLLKEFDCGCETCARTAAVCPATASALFQEVAILREHRDRLTTELDSLRKELK